MVLRQISKEPHSRSTRAQSAVLEHDRAAEPGLVLFCPDASGAAQADHPQRRVLALCDRQCSDAAWLGEGGNHARQLGQARDGGGDRVPVASLFPAVHLEGFQSWSSACQREQCLLPQLPPQLQGAQPQQLLLRRVRQRCAQRCQALNAEARQPQHLRAKGSAQRSWHGIMAWHGMAWPHVMHALLTSSVGSTCSIVGAKQACTCHTDIAVISISRRSTRMSGEATLCSRAKSAGAASRSNTVSCSSSSRAAGSCAMTPADKQRIIWSRRSTRSRCMLAHDSNIVSMSI
jgi:hypothetical protein